MNFKNAFDTISNIIFAVVAVVAAVETGATGAADSATKKADALKQLTALVTPLVPDFLRGFLPTLLGFLIDAVVAAANKQGFFTKSAGA